MCGIAVAIGWDQADATVRKLIAGILHRGDVTDPVVSPRPDTALCTRRLRIVDGDNAVQPQASFDGKLLLSFNGEIYNHAALRAELESLGVPFRTGSDTEVLVNALQVWGAKALKRLVGMFAFVAFDVATGEFLAARDPFGVKPLYLVQSGSGFLFCSEIQPLLNATQSGDVMLLPPGYLLTRNLCTQYSVLGTPPELGESDPAELDSILAEAVRIRLPDGLPVATLFSGGIDSTLVTHYARQFRPETPGYILGGPEAPDFVYAKRYADQTGLDLRIVPFDPQSRETLSLMDKVVEATESFEPTVVRGGLCSYLTARRLHEDGFRVALCGEAADELFAGYVALEHVFAQGDTLGQQVRDQYFGLMHRSNLQRVDRCPMRFEVEIREPFLDPAVVTHALGLKASALVRTVDGKLRGKMALRNLYDLYPAELPTLIRDRQKVAFDEGAGLELTGAAPPWTAMFEDVVTDKEFEAGKRDFAGFELASKEEFFYLSKLAAKMDVARVPHLRARLRLQVPDGTPGMADNIEPLRAQ